MKIDIYAHVCPEKYKIEGIQTLWDLETRFRIMDHYDDYMQVITVIGGPIEAVAKGPDAVELAKITNDEAAELVSKYPDRFLGAAANLPLDDTEAALRELDRAINELKLKGILIHTPLYFLSEGVRPPAGGSH